ncbi:MAG: RagB/SusD family nutrient uptake outer membrane protein [Chitinophagaceae bacterium]|nr:RagB/SusD family nutrient uptake outer membrane protein [Chitinophagaceae bacterium]
MTKLNIIIISLSLLVVSSCSKNLDVDPTSVITTASFWKTEDDAKGALSGMYVNLRNSSTAIFMIGEQRSEIYQNGPIGPSDLILFRNVLTADNPGHPDWSGFYNTINSANLILKYVPEIDFKSEDAKNRVLAQAHAMRAFINFVMVKTWGDIIIRTEPVESSDAEVTQKERSPKTEAIALIKQDIETALSLFPDNNFEAGRSFWSKAGVNALKADVYLWTGKVMGGGDADFNTALAACNEVALADVELLPNFADLFKYENKGNKETVMTIRYQDLEGASDNYFWFMWILAGSVPANIDDATRDLIFPISGGQDRMVITDLVRNQFTADDSRKNGSFYEIFTYDDNNNPTFYTTLCLKGSGVDVGGARKFLSDVVLYRYADVLLMKAEAKNALGQDPSDEMNAVRQRAYGANYNDHVFANGTQEQNDAAILKERLFELLYEGKRWWDLVRFDKAFELVPALQDRAGQTDLLLFPIANTVLSLEPKVHQNPGY